MPCPGTRPIARHILRIFKHVYIFFTQILTYYIQFSTLFVSLTISDWLAQISTCPFSPFLSHVWFFVTPMDVACQVPLSMEFSRQEYWSGLLCPPPGGLPDPRIEPVSLMSPALVRRFFTTSTSWTWVQMLNCFFCQIPWVTDVSFSHRKLILNLDSRQKILSDPNTVLYLSTAISWLKEHSNEWMLGGSNFDMNSPQ